MQMDMRIIFEKLTSTITSLYIYIYNRQKFSPPAGSVFVYKKKLYLNDSILEDP